MPINATELRFTKQNVCQECMETQATCGGTGACISVKKELIDYGGVRYTSDGFDCAFPVSIDAHSVCSFGCLYCFAPNLIQNREKTTRPVGQTSLSFLEGIFSGRPGKVYEEFREVLKYDKKRNGYPCAVQCGALTDPFDNIERNQGWTLKFMDLAIKYNQPVRFSTKGNLFLTEEYINKFKQRPELFWVAFSIITPDDKLIMKIDKRAPPASERIECMKRLSQIGVKTSLRFRPIMPGISDSTPDYPHAWRDLVDAAANAGAKAISCETVFLPGMMTQDIKERWEEIEGILNKPMKKIYRNFGKTQACTRPSYKWTEEIIFAITERARAKGLAVGVSSPDWKQLNDYGCCCGISPDDPVFGNWERCNATNALVNARDGKISEITYKDFVPDWAYNRSLHNLLNPGVGPTAAWTHRHGTWAEKLLDVVNNADKERSPLNYFQGALQPIKRDEKGNLVYKYVGLTHTNRKNTPFWTVKDE